MCIYNLKINKGNFFKHNKFNKYKHKFKHYNNKDNKLVQKFKLKLTKTLNKIIHFLL